MHAFEFQRLDTLRDDQINLYAGTLPEIVNTPQMKAQFEMRDLGQTRRDLQTSNAAAWLLANMRGKMYDSEDSEYFMITRQDQPDRPIGMAARTQQPLRRLGSEGHTFTDGQMAELGSHVVAWLDSTRQYTDSLDGLSAVYKKLSFKGSDLRGNPTNVWTVEPIKALERGPRLNPKLFVGEALRRADFTRDNPKQPAPYAVAHTTNPLIGQRQQALYHTASSLSFDPATAGSK